MKIRWWWLAVIGMGLVALALLSPRVTGQEPQQNPQPQALFINMGDLWRTRGESMLPAIQDGDYVLIRPSKLRPQVGQIILYYDFLTSRYVGHRVVEVGEDNQGWLAYVKGDNSPERSWVPVRASNMVGVGIWRITMW